jgi:hypothetical protein
VLTLNFSILEADALIVARVNSRTDPDLNIVSAIILSMMVNYGRITLPEFTKNFVSQIDGAKPGDKSLQRMFTACRRIRNEVGQVVASKLGAQEDRSLAAIDKIIFGYLFGEAVNLPATDRRNKPRRTGLYDSITDIFNKSSQQQICDDQLLKAKSEAWLTEAERLLDEVIILDASQIARLRVAVGIADRKSRLFDSEASFGT